MPGLRVPGGIRCTRAVPKPLRPRGLGQLPCKGSLSRTAKPSEASLPPHGGEVAAKQAGGALPACPGKQPP